MYKTYQEFMLATNPYFDINGSMYKYGLEIWDACINNFPQPQENLADSSQAVQQLKAEIAKKLQWYKQQQCDGGLEVDIPSVIDDLKQLAAIE